MKRWHWSIAAWSALAPTTRGWGLTNSNPHRRRSSALSSSNSPEATEEETFASAYHAPVMWKECLDALLAGRDNNDSDDRPPLVLVDGTLGGGGHAQAILTHLRAGDVLLGCDVDPDALATASERLAAYMGTTTDASSSSGTALPLFIPVHSNFGDLAAQLPKVLHPATQEPLLPPGLQSVDGILLDLGVSSFQIDTAERGFAFMKDGPLDMRMGQTSGGHMSAADICNELDAFELKRILKVYGDEPRARAIAQSIGQHRPLTTTQDLVTAVAAVTPEFARKGRRMGRTATLARVFQALRIFVNQEDVVLERALMEMAPAVLKPGGRLVVLSYHSMEDRMAKRVFRDGSVRKKRTDERDMYGNYNGSPLPFTPVGKAQKASDAEVEVNSRARSATLRVAVRQ